MPTTCPHCGTTSPATADACTGCGRDLYRLSNPTAAPDHNSVPSLWLNLRPNRPWMWITTGAVLLLVGAGATAGLMLKHGGDEGPAEERISQHKVPGPDIKIDPSPSKSPEKKKTGKPLAASSSPSEPAEPAPTKSESPDKPSEGLPAGFRRVNDEMGFSLAVMDGWQRRSLSETHVDYVPPTGQEVLRIGESANAGPSSADTFAQAEQQLASNDPSYKRIRLESNTFQGRPGAIWEFTWTTGSGQVMHATDQAYIAEDGTEYTIYFEARDRLWDKKNQVFTTALNTWKAPANGVAGAAAEDG
ncbi:hypothetical protein GCM10012287_53360 [Streptomyces daqingensis]|uniref:Zinc ribbon domain-containing protein n=1 Tax=Streptomyces daqingensis TaxID=1472640 RepID=A0ABQ2MTA1_9ACTN|nr:hypothetical protein GCM10012287_53360 [Streptomyces daqingensis]